MKLQYLILIFLLIMTPIYMVFSKYVDVQINNINIQNTYDSKLRDATYDAVKAFQVNTLNSSKYVPESRVKFSKASVNAFYTALNLAFGFNGENNKVMNEYVPAVVLTMYDGYYIYSPFVNNLTEVDDDKVDEEYEDNKTLSDLKPYVSYSCNYKKNANTDYIITYSLDNYILVDEFNHDIVNGYHKRHEGYLIGLNQYTGVESDASGNITKFKFNGIDFSNDTKERLKEYLIDENGDGQFYNYTIRNGTKYYFGTTDDKGNIIGPGDISQNLDDNNTRDVIFYIDDSGARMKQRENYKDNKANFLDYYNDIKNNNLAFEYYRDAYVFTNWVKDNLNELNAGGENSCIKNSANYDGYNFAHIDNIFGECESNIEDSNSKFNQHRRDVIRAVIQTNLSSAISGFSIYSKADENINFIMPKISEEDWDLLENKSCIATFLQGFPIGSSNNTYNSYSVIPNNKTREFVDEENIYVIKNDNTYAKINEKNYTLASVNALKYYPAMWNINFEARQLNGNTYIPTSYKNGDEYIPYLQSYSSMMGTDLDSYSDIYKYMRGKEDSDKAIKEAYYVALGRERKGTFKFTNYDDEIIEENLEQTNSGANNQGNSSTNQGEPSGGGQTNPSTEHQEVEENYYINSKGVYVATLAEAIELADFGDTIIVNKNITDNSDVNIVKNITIDLNEKTLTRSSVINITGGLTKIIGNGKIKSDSVCIIRYSLAASLYLSNVQLITNAHVIERESNGTGELKIYNSSIISRYANTLHLEGKGNVDIYDSTIVAEAKNSNAIGTFDQGVYNINIGGKSIVACALENKALPGEWENAKGSAVYLVNGGKLTVKGRACIIAGPYTNNAITVQNWSSVEFVGSSSVYAYNKCCVSGGYAGSIFIETDGCLYAKDYVISVNRCSSFNYVKAQMASVDCTRMTKIGGTQSNNAIRKGDVSFKNISGYYENGMAKLKNENKQCFIYK